jgi:glutamine synthetase
MYSARIQICETMEDSFGMPVENHSHGRAPTAQQTFSISEKGLRDAADAVCTLKFIVRNLANAVNASSTFMPYPVEGEKGNRQSIGISLWKAADNNVFYDAKEDYAQFSQSGRYFIGGIIEHANALSLFTAPTPNSYKRLAADPITVGWSKEKNESLVVITNERKNDKEGKKIVYMGGDPAANSYLAYSTVLAAGLDGMKNKIDPGEPSDSADEKKKRTSKALPTSLYGAIEALESDTKFIKGVLPGELLGDYLDLKLAEHKRSITAISGWEVEKYYNI